MWDRMNIDHKHRQFAEWYADAGTVHAALSERWSCVMAHFTDERAKTFYKAQWPWVSTVVSDAPAVELPFDLDLCWLSCGAEDMAIARPLVNGGRRVNPVLSNILDVLRWNTNRYRGPKVIVLTTTAQAAFHGNALNTLSVLRRLQEMDYRIGAFVVDAADFVPMSRRHLVIVAARRHLPFAMELFSDRPDPAYTPSFLIKALSRAPEIKEDWLWWKLPPRPHRSVKLEQLIDSNVDWEMEGRVLLKRLGRCSRERVMALIRSKKSVVTGACYRVLARKKNDAIKRVIDVRPDGVVGSITYVRGSSSRPWVLMVKKGELKARRLLPREAARLMGLPDEQPLPETTEHAFAFLARMTPVPVVKWIHDHIVEPFLDRAVSGRLYRFVINPNKQAVHEEEC